MIIQDIMINYSITTNERYNSLEKHLEKLVDGEPLVFLGETFYVMDLYLASIERFIQFLNQYSQVDIYIQDFEMSSNEQLSDSWYSIIEWPEHVHVFTNLTTFNEEYEDIDLMRQKRIAYKSEGSKKRREKESDIPIDGIYASHKGDLVSLFIEDIRSKSYDTELEEAIILEGLQYLLRW